MKTLRPRVATLATGPRSIVSGSWRAAGAGANERGYTYAWQQARKAFLEANPLCVKCDELGDVEPATLVDHKIPHGGNMELFWDRANWAGLCAHHHSSDKQREERGGAWAR